MNERTSEVEGMAQKSENEHPPPLPRPPKDGLPSVSEIYLQRIYRRDWRDGENKEPRKPKTKTKRNPDDVTERERERARNSGFERKSVRELKRCAHGAAEAGREKEKEERGDGRNAWNAR